MFTYLILYSVLIPNPFPPAVLLRKSLSYISEDAALAKKVGE